MRAELPALIEQGADAELQFPVEGVGLEFQVAMTSKARRGKARFWVVVWGTSVSGFRAPARAVEVSLGALVNQAGDVVGVKRRSWGNRGAWPGVGGGAAVW